MSTTDILPAAVALAPRWHGDGVDDGSVETAEHEDEGADWSSASDVSGASGWSGRTDWGGVALRSALVDPCGQHFRPHLFGM
ncbi:hypothetical protein [Haloechinothrix halophila]|uniref:hypothetical protein n=1 Tax=Haloechinothrix halophila TaxID=1069073 RepID=UPI00054F8BE6|nr:hypothetical protein [Haloechinothrix halophila]